MPGFRLPSFALGFGGHGVGRNDKGKARGLFAAKPEGFEEWYRQCRDDIGHCRDQGF